MNLFDYRRTGMFDPARWPTAGGNGEKNRYPFDEKLPGMDGAGWFDIKKPVGSAQPNQREDVIKVETILGNTGHFDIKGLGGPTGYIGSVLDEGIRNFQKQNGLEVDGILNPGGPTIATARKKLGGLLDGYTPPTPGQVEDHHTRVKAGEDGILITQPQVPTLKPIPGLLEINGDEYAMNRRSADYLARETATVGEHPRWTAGDIIELGPAGIARARDLVDQIGELDPQRAGEYASGILDWLKDDTHKRAFLGGDPPPARPLGILAAEAPERMGQADSANEEKTADATPEPAAPTGAAEGQDAALAGDVGENAIKETTEDAAEEERDDGGADDEAEPANSPTDRGGQGDQAPGQPEEANPQDDREKDQQLAENASDKPAPEDTFVAKDPQQFLKENEGKVLDDGKGGYKGECVSLVKQAVPGIGNTASWKPGEQLKADGGPELKPGTAIATFKDGKYQGDQKHAAIFQRYDTNDQGQKGIVVIDQHRKKGASETFIPFEPGADPRKNAGAYFVIKR